MCSDKIAFSYLLGCKILCFLRGLCTFRNTFFPLINTYWASFICLPYEVLNIEDTSVEKKNNCCVNGDSQSSERDWWITNSLQYSCIQGRIGPRVWGTFRRDSENFRMSSIWDQVMDDLACHTEDFIQWIMGHCWRFVFWREHVSFCFPVLIVMLY